LENLGIRDFFQIRNKVLTREYEIEEILETNPFWYSSISMINKLIDAGEIAENEACSAIRFFIGPIIISPVL
jgi:hypothetical protein